jgi:2-polyprenyl-3-methyl-5-hydroxy-6-metoxy-1,4-benzoquinol methylase
MLPETSAVQQTRQKWNARYQDIAGVPLPAQVLGENRHLLPTAGRALDLACGLGGNALLLAEHGLDTWAWDIADVAIQRLQQTAQQRGLAIRAEVRDVVALPPPPESFDVLVVSRFLERELAPTLLQALRPHGLLFYQTLTHYAAQAGRPRNPAYLLAPQELLRLFRPLHLLVYREDGQVGDKTRGLRQEAMLVGQKPG